MLASLVLGKFSETIHIIESENQRDWNMQVFFWEVLCSFGRVGQDRWGWVGNLISPGSILVIRKLWQLRYSFSLITDRHYSYLILNNPSPHSISYFWTGKTVEWMAVLVMMGMHYYTKWLVPTIENIDKAKASLLLAEWFLHKIFIKVTYERCSHISSNS